MQIKKSEFLAALQAAKIGVAAKDVIDQTTSFAFMGDVVVSYNDEISVRAQLPESVQLHGCVKAEPLLALLSKATKDEIEITCTDTEMLVKAGRTKAGFTLESEIRLPLDEVNTAVKWKSVPSSFFEALSFVAFAAGTDMSKPVLTCVHANTHSVEASDGYCIMKVETEELPVSPFLLPANTAKMLAGLKLTKIGMSPDSQGWVHFKNKSVTISCRVFEDAFPAIEPFLKENKQAKSFVMPQSVSDMLDRLSVFTKKDRVFDEVLEVSLVKGKLKLKGRNDYGWAEESAAVEFDGSLSFTITPTLLRDIVTKGRNCKVSNDSIVFSESKWIYLAKLRTETSV